MYCLLNVNQTTSKQTCIFGLREDVANLEKKKEIAKGKAIHKVREEINDMINSHQEYSFFGIFYKLQFSCEYHNNSIFSVLSYANNSETVPKGE